MRASRRVTISDVAAASGVGVGTVSRVINGAANVREATRLSVLTVIEQLGYRPSHLAASLSRGTSRTVAIVVPHLTRPSTVERLAGALGVLGEQGYDTVICNVDARERRDHFLAVLTDRHRVDGVIVMSLRMEPAQLAAFRRTEVPLVTADARAPGFPETVIDDVAGGRLATARLIALGHRRIGFVGDAVARQESGLGFTSSRRRLAGYRRELQAAGADCDLDLVRLGPHGPAAAAELGTELLTLPDPPTAIFAASDTQAMGVLSAAERAGCPVPGSLSVIGFDDIEAATLLGLSTVQQPLRLSGSEAAGRLCTLLRGERVRPRRQLLTLRVVERASLAPPAVAKMRAPDVNSPALAGKRGLCPNRTGLLVPGHSLRPGAPTPTPTPTPRWREYETWWQSPARILAGCPRTRGLGDTAQRCRGVLRRAGGIRPSRVRHRQCEHRPGDAEFLRFPRCLRGHSD